MTISSKALLGYANGLDEIRIFRPSGILWRTVDAGAFVILAENNALIGTGSKSKLRHCFLQIQEDDALLLIDRVRRAAMVRGRPSISTASKTTVLERFKTVAPVHRHRWKPANHRFQPAARADQRAVLAV